MLKIFIWSVFLMMAPTTASPPLDLDWQGKHKLVPEMDGYRYWYGDLNYDPLVYVSTEDVLSMESEVHLYFVSKRLARAVLIFGPAGITEHNCTEKHSQVVSLLNKKYGHFKYRKIERDPLAADLFYTSICKPVQLGLQTLMTIWKTPEYKIVSLFMGDEDGFYIEVDYINLRRNETRQRNKRKILLKKI